MVHHFLANGFRKYHLKKYEEVVEAQFGLGFGEVREHMEHLKTLTPQFVVEWADTAQSVVLESISKRIPTGKLVSIFGKSDEVQLQPANETWRLIGQVIGMYDVLLKSIFPEIKATGKEIINTDIEVFKTTLGRFKVFCNQTEMGFIIEYLREVCRVKCNDLHGNGNWKMLYFECIALLSA
ncbi:MAG: hypothetical protein Q7S65_04205 [Nanoarchaeota archaeon]|nr:hypothetical protein [Nanoarchaeota archaeon]